MRAIEACLTGELDPLTEVQSCVAGLRLHESWTLAIPGPAELPDMPAGVSRRLGKRIAPAIRTTL